MNFEKSSGAVDAYLNQLRAELHGLPKEEVEEFLREIRAHILEYTSADPANGWNAAVQSLGEPTEIAQEYRVQISLARVALTSHPGRVLRATLQWASVRALGGLVFAIALAGYLTGAVLVVCALFKPLYPGVIGLWSVANRLLLGLLVQSHSGQKVFGVSIGLWPPSFVIGTVGRLAASPTEILGWWIIPAAIAAGALIVYLTTRLVRGVAAEVAKPIDRQLYQIGGMPPRRSPRA